MCTYRFVHTHARTHNTYTSRHRYRYRHTHTYWATSMKQWGYSVSVISIWLRVDMGFMLSPVHQGPRKSTLFSSEFYPEKKKNEENTARKSSTTWSSPRANSFLKKVAFRNACFSSLSLEAGNFPKTSEWSSSLVSWKAFKRPSPRLPLSLFPFPLSLTRC